MSPPLNFLWIDDDPNRVENFRTLIERAGNIKSSILSVYSVENKDVVTEIPAILGQVKPDLVVIDHVFSNAGGNGLREGSTVATALREKWNSVPIVGVTAALQVTSKRKHFDRLKTAEYIDLFDWDQFDKYIPDLFVISCDFKKLVATTLDNPAKFLKLLDCKVDAEILTSILPSEFKEKPDSSTPHTFARWTIHKFIGRPGFLYDEARTATLLGLTLKGFNKIKSRFTSCIYKGVFASPTRTRWWPKLIRSKLYNIVPKDSSNLPWIAGRQLSGINKRDFSKCYLCDAESPETMAFPDEKTDTLFSVCLKHTIPHPRTTTMIGFDELRIFKPS